MRTRATASLGFAVAMLVLAVACGAPPPPRVPPPSTDPPSQPMEPMAEPEAAEE